MTNKSKRAKAWRVPKGWRKLPGNEVIRYGDKWFCDVDRIGGHWILANGMIGITAGEAFDTFGHYVRKIRQPKRGGGK